MGGGISIKANSFKVKLVAIFIIPSFAFLYFSYLYIQNEYALQDKISKYQHSTKIIVTLSNLVYTLQLERGLSAGYIVSNEINLKTDLLEQYKMTDNAYNKLLKISKNSFFLSDISIKNQNIIFNAIDLVKNINDTRSSVMDSSIDFEREISYYSSINNLLILSIKNINSKFSTLQNDNGTIDNLLQIQEYSGLQRAYTYNFLLSHEKTNKLLFGIDDYIKHRKIVQESLLLSASKDFISIYNKLYKKDMEEKIYYCSKNILNNNFHRLDAEKCFEASTKYINMLDNIYQNILNSYIKKANILYENSLKYLYFTYVIAVLSIFMVLLLFGNQLIMLQTH